MFADVLESPSHKTAIKSILFIQQKIAVQKCHKVLLKGCSRILKDHNTWPELVVTFFQRRPNKKWW